MKLYTVRAEDWKIDGGAAFGVVPKTIWSKQYTADENNNVLMSNRLLLIEEGERLMLIDTGMGSKREDKYYKFKYLQKGNDLLKSLKNNGFEPEQITDVIITHLHDDHVGGAVFHKEGESELLFPNANHWLSKSQWDWALNPNMREIGAYFNDNFLPIKEAGKLKFVEEENFCSENVELRIYDGHTKGCIMPIIKYNDKKIAYVGDVIPFAASIPLPFISATDVQPLLSLKEKEDFLNEAAKNNYYLFFEHDYFTELCTVEYTPKRIVFKEAFKLNDIL